MRDRGIGHWVRFHSLPRSKRYPDTPEEVAILLARQNSLARAVLGAEGKCWLVQACWAPERNSGLHDRFRAVREHGLEFAFSFPAEDPQDDVSWSVFAGKVAWSASTFRALLLQIAQNLAGRTLWMSGDERSIFAPYDGGVDLFLSDPARVEFLRARHSSWLSDHPNGL